MNLRDKLLYLNRNIAGGEQISIVFGPRIYKTARIESTYGVVCESRDETSLNKAVGGLVDFVKKRKRDEKTTKKEKKNE